MAERRRTRKRKRPTPYVPCECVVIASLLGVAPPEDHLRAASTVKALRTCPRRHAREADGASAASAAAEPPLDDGASDDAPALVPARALRLASNQPRECLFHPAHANHAAALAEKAKASL